MCKYYLHNDNKLMIYCEEDKALHNSCNSIGQHLDALGTDVAERPLLLKDIAQGILMLLIVQ